MTNVDGEFRFEDVPVGEFSISVVVVLADGQLGAIVTDVLTSDGQNLAFRDDDDDLDRDAIALEPSGTVTGQIQLSDGTIPADGAVVEFMEYGTAILKSPVEADSSATFPGPRADKT